MAKRSACRTEGGRLRSIAAEKQLLHFAAQLLRGSFQRLAPRIDDERALWVQLTEMQADGLADAPLDAVADHGRAQRARRGESDMGAIRLGFANTKGGEEGTDVARPLVIDPSEILRPQQTDSFRKTRDGDYLSELTVSFVRPRARRRASTARPFLVSMRLRNPCVFARWRLFG